MDLKQLFGGHIKTLRENYDEAFRVFSKEGRDMNAILIHSGSEGVYHADDRHIPFAAYGHFNHWIPINRPDQMVMIEPGKKPTYFKVVAKDFWYDQTFPIESWWADQFNIVELGDHREVSEHLPNKDGIAFMGENRSFAMLLGLPNELHNDPDLIGWLDYQRGVKTAYEVEQLRAANKQAMLGHAAARDAFQKGGSEYEIHLAYLEACGILESESPYTNIIALDEKSAILHYQYKRRASGADSKVLLIDAGCRVNAYCSDITRTELRGETHPVFAGICADVNQLELDLVGKVEAGKPYPNLHVAAHEAVGEMLKKYDLYKGSMDELKEHKISSLFFPHGIGHLLGIQVHDVAGHYRNEWREKAEPPEEYPHLRSTRNMEVGQVFTIEPGFYFIPVLLDPVRGTERGSKLNWDLIDSLIPYGGIRFEDNIHVTENGAENLTR